MPNPAHSFLARTTSVPNHHDLTWSGSFAQSYDVDAPTSLSASASLSPSRFNLFGRSFNRNRVEWASQEVPPLEPVVVDDTYTSLSQPIPIAHKSKVCPQAMLWTSLWQQRFRLEFLPPCTSHSLLSVVPSVANGHPQVSEDTYISMSQPISSVHKSSLRQPCTLAPANILALDRFWGCASPCLMVLLAPEIS
jgi:hypothetical protein